MFEAFSYKNAHDISILQASFFTHKDAFQRWMKMRIKGGCEGRCIFRYSQKSNALATPIYSAILKYIKKKNIWGDEKLFSINVP